MSESINYRICDLENQMNQYIVITVAGTDRVGLVDQITKILLEYNSNVEESRMARLGGEFAAIILISIPEKKVKDLAKGLEKLEKLSLTVSSKITQTSDTRRFEGYVPYEIYVTGADQEGIVHRVSHYLSENGINIETLESSVVNAPTTGTPLFSMHGIVQAPAKITLIELRKRLNEIGNEMGTDIDIKMLVK